MKTVQIRKSRVVTVYEASDIVTLNPKKFKNLSENPYTGNSDKEFLEYIGLSESEFVEIIDRNRSPHIWTDNSGTRVLKSPIWDE